MVGYSGTPLAKKLGIAESTTAAVLGAPPGFIALLGETLPGTVALRTRAAGTADVVVSFHTERAHLEARVEALVRTLDVDGGLWIAWPKRASGVPTDATEDTVREVFLPLGLVDNKVCAIDDTWSGLRVVWRKELRAERRAQRARTRPVTRVGCFPGTFDPLTVAHVAVAEAARDAAGLDRVDLVLSEVTLGKEHLGEGDAYRRAEAARAVVSDRPWLAVVVSPHRLVVDLAQGYDAVVMGADKWRQVTDPAWYGDDPAARDAALARLPRVLVAPRADDHPADVELLDVHPEHRHVRASAIRAGDPDAQRWTAT